ncbi:MAG: nitroreductase family protein [Bacteroidales bacterium]|nr:nitroreductase family protein [Bacteroidales bacterium]
MRNNLMLLFSVLLFMGCLLSFDSYAQEGKKCCGKCNHTKQNTTLETIFSRKSVRAFNGKTISKDTLELIVKAGMAAPTGMNRQPWDFVIIDNKADMEALAKKMPRAKMLQTAGAAIVVVGNQEVSKNWMLDCAAATENILLAVESMGLGAVWTAGWPYEDRIAEINGAFNIPQPYIPLCLIPIGYPTGDNTPKDKWKPERVHYNKW